MEKHDLIAPCSEKLAEILEDYPDVVLLSIFSGVDTKKENFLEEFYIKLCNNLL